MTAAEAVELIRAGECERLRAALRENPELIRERHRGETLLGLVAQPNVFGEWVSFWRFELGVDRACVEAIIEAGAELNEPFSIAACFNRTELMELLLAAGADIRHVGPDGLTALEAALYHGSREAADRIAAVEIYPYALWTAAALGRIDLMDGAPTDHRPDPSKVGWGPREAPRPEEDEILAEAFVEACHNGRTDAAGWLLERGADLNAGPYYGMTGLHWAVAGNQLEAARFLVERRIDVEIRHRGGWSALDHAHEMVRRYPGCEPVRDFLASLGTPSSTAV